MLELENFLELMALQLDSKGSDYLSARHQVKAAPNRPSRVIMDKQAPVWLWMGI